MKLWLDDLRPAPDDSWTHTRTAREASALLERGGVEAVSLDHDLGEAEDAGDGYAVACWIEQHAASGSLARLTWAVHSANPVGRAKMEAALLGAGRHWEAHQAQPGRPVRVELISDLHFEDHADCGLEFVAQLDAADVDVLVVAGDLASAELLPDAFARLCDLYPAVVYVAGNHEFFGGAPGELFDLLGLVGARLPNLVALENEAREVAGLRFAGTTLWYPRTRDALLSRNVMPDFARIDDFEPWVWEASRRAKDFLGAEAAKADIVVTHHLPSWRSVGPEFAGDTLNACFVHDVLGSCCSQGRPPIWMHGHTHRSVDYVERGVRVLCNPFGGPEAMNPTYVEKFVIDVPPWIAGPRDPGPRIAQVP
jgi:predicted phosphodiesterase